MLWSMFGHLMVKSLEMFILWALALLRENPQVGFSLLQRKENYYGKIKVMEKG